MMADDPGPVATSPARWGPALGLTLLVLASTWAGVGNGWVQDDLPIIFVNALVHSLGNLGQLFTHSYWPAPYPPDLYRPMAMVGFALQWSVAGGEPLVFRLVSIALYLVVTLALWRLALRLLPRGPAWVVAALFAVHPVHVEAVAVAVNQGELLVALVLILGMNAWIDRRKAGAPTGGWWGARLAAAYFVGILIKEHAVVFPALLAALEFTVLDDRRPFGTRLREHRQFLLGAALAVVLAVAMRDQVLAGNTRGSFTAEALEGLGVGGRALTMLSVVPEWARLLIWPRHLQADYSLQEIVPATGFGAAQLLGTALLLLAIVILLACRRRLPVAAFGVGWLAIALGPVHNVLVPTGIVLAERTLFLGSAGFLLGGVALLAGARERVAARWPRGTRGVVLAGLGALLAMGISRSTSRQRVWHDLPTLWRQTLTDAPLSYRAHHAWAEILFKGGAKGPAEQHFRRAIALHPRGWPVYLELADKYRLSGNCWPAVDLYTVALGLNPMHSAGRGSLIACLVHIGRYAEAAEAARIGVELGDAAETFARYAEVADSALRVGAPAESVKLPAPIPASPAAR